MKKNCPLCGEELAPAYEERSIMWVLEHLRKSHLVSDNMDHKVSAVLCLCRKKFRGVHSWAAHIASLEGDDLISHQLESSKGCGGNLIPRKRCQTWD